jgi:MULE transposase domain
LLPQILEMIARTTPGTKFKISTCDTSDNNVKMFKSIVWAYGPCIAAFKYLRPVIIIDAGFLSGRYKVRLLMSCGYDAENKVIPLAFGIVNAENVDDWGWIMRWVRNEVIQSNMKICVISDRHRGIKEFLSDRIWDGMYNMERWYTSIACNTSQIIYIRNPKNLERKKIIS